MHVWRLLVFSWLFISCGHDQEQSLPPQVIIASDQQIEDLQVKANSYLVMFKTIAGLKQLRFHSYRAEVQYFAGFVNERYQFDNGVKDLRTITAVEMPTFTTSSPFSGLSWQQQQPTEVGILVEATFANNKLAAAHLNHWQQQGDIYFAEPNYLSTIADGPSPGEDVTKWDNCRAKCKAPPCDNEENTQVKCLSCLRLCDQAQNYTKYSSETVSEGEKPSSSKWWHKKVNLSEAMAYIAEGVANKTDSNLIPPNLEVLIAVFDSGIDYDHPALKGKIYENKEGKDYGCLNDSYGCNTTAADKESLGNGETRPWGTNQAEREAQGGGSEGGKCPNAQAKGYHSCPHGTHVAGIIVADGEIGEKNPLKMSGVCPFCRVVNVRVLSEVTAKKDELPRGGITDSALLNGLKYVDNMYWAGQNVRVVNASIGKFHRSRSVALLISLLKERDGGGVLVIGAAGNEDTMARTYPAALDSVLAVSATDDQGRKSTFSNLGMWVDIAAPGGGGGNGNSIESTIPGVLGYKGESGTSMATPVVSGIAGLFLSVWADKELEATLLEDYLIASSNRNALYSNDVYKTGKPHPYLANIETIDEPVPLLGKGLVDALRMVNGTRDNDLARVDLEGEDYRRVDWSSCGTVTGGSTSSIYLLLLIIGILPLVLRGYQ